MDGSVVNRMLIACVASGMMAGVPGRAQSVAANVHAESVRLASVTVDAVDVPLARVLDVIARQAGLSTSWDGKVFNSNSRVTLHVRDIPVDEAFSKALVGTGLKAEISAKIVAFVPVVSTTAHEGIVSGTVIDAKTKRPVRNATISLDGARKGVTSGDDGTFRILHVENGTHTVHVRMVGYAKTTKEITVGDGQAASVDVVLEPSVNALDQVVVTGTVIPTELKAVSNAITVITAKQLEERGITHIDQLFRGDVPGLFAYQLDSNNPLGQVTMFSRGTTSLNGGGMNPEAGKLSNPIKTYVDGIEMADPSYLSQIDPASIERIEIISGPQASTIYGSNALNGVMQIFTKRGTSTRPQIALNFENGWLQNNFNSTLTPVHNYMAQANGVEGRVSYNLGGSWDYTGRWTPASQTARTSGFGGVRYEVATPVGRVATDLTGRRQNTHNDVAGGSINQLAGVLGNNGLWNTGSGSSYNGANTSALTGQTFGLSLAYSPASWWSNELKLADDFEDTQSLKSQPAYTAPYDTSLILSQSHSDRRQIGYLTTLRVPIASVMQLTMTGGADNWQSLALNSTLNSTASLSGPNLQGLVSSYGRQASHNTGGFVQARAGFFNHLFVDYGVRAEWNPDFGKEAPPALSPKVGIVVTHDLGMVTAKIRGTYGRSTRPPLRAAKQAIPFDYAANCAYNIFWCYFPHQFDDQLGNPDLGPETQKGGEGGLELYFGGRASLIVTRYNQTVDNLIAGINAVDSVHTVLTNPGGLCNRYPRECASNGYIYYQQRENLNVANIRNQGWELQGSVTTGPFTTRGNYSWTKSRSLGMTARFLAKFDPHTFPLYQPGASFQGIGFPEHTWSLATTYALGRTSASLTFDGVGRSTINLDRRAYDLIYPTIRLQSYNANVTTAFSTNGYVAFHPGYANTALDVTQHLMSRMDGTLHVSNLTNRYDPDYFVGYATMGRQTNLGLRIRL